MIAASEKIATSNKAILESLGHASSDSLSRSIGKARLKTASALQKYNNKLNQPLSRL